MVMERKEALVQLDDDLVEELDRIAAARGANRDTKRRELDRALRYSLAVRN